VILITTDSNELSGTIPTEIGQLTALVDVDLCKYDRCLRSFHAPIAVGLSSHMKTPLEHHCHSSPCCPFLLILITTAENELFGTIPTEIGQLTELAFLALRKYDGCLCSFHALLFIYKLTTGSAVSSILFLQQMKTN
jgi:hypothetical protein